MKSIYFIVSEKFERNFIILVGLIFKKLFKNFLDRKTELMFQRIFLNKIIKCLFIAKFLLLNIMTDGREEIIYDLSSFL